MNLQFNVFGFNVQISRHPQYFFEVHYSEFDQGHYVPFSGYAQTETGALIQAWRHARRMAKFDNSKVEFVILRFEHPEWHVHRVGRIVVKTAIGFFPKFN